MNTIVRMDGLQTFFWAVCATLLLYAVGGLEVVLAQGGGLTVPPGPTDANGLLAKFVDYLKAFANTALVAIVIISFVIAAYAAITGFARVYSGRGEWGGMFLLFLVAIIVTIFVGQIAYDGSQAINNL